MSRHCTKIFIKIHQYLTEIEPRQKKNAHVQKVMEMGTINTQVTKIEIN